MTGDTLPDNQASFNAAANRAFDVLQPSDGWKAEALVHSIQRLIVPLRATPDQVTAARKAYATDLCARARSLDVADADLLALCADASMASTPWEYYTESRRRKWLPPRFSPKGSRLSVFLLARSVLSYRTSRVVRF